MAGRRAIRGVVGVGLSLLLSGCWLQPDYDAGRTRWNPWEHEITVVNVASLEKVWSVEVPSTRPNAPAPLVYGDRVYVPTETLASVPGRYSSSIGVRALDGATGETVWEQAVNPPEEVGNPLLPLTVVENELWLGYLPQSSDEPESSDACRAEIVRLDLDGTVVGAERTHTLSGAMQSGPYVVQIHRAPCEVAPQTLVVRDSRTLETLWTAESFNFSSAVVSGGLVITAAGAFPLAGCGAPTCAPIWNYTEGGSVAAAGPDTDVFFVKGGGFSPSIPGRLDAVSRATGTRTWSAAIPWQAGPDDVAVDDEHVYVTARNTNTTVLAYDVDGCGAATCSPEWMATVGPDVVDSWVPTVAGDVVYVAGRDGRVYAFAAGGCGPDSSSNCPEIASFDTGLGDSIGGMAVSGGRLFVLGVAGETFNLSYTVKAFAPTTTP